MTAVRNWKLTCPGSDGRIRTVRVASTGAVGPHGHQLYASEDGRLLAEITGSGLIHRISSGDGLLLTLTTTDGLVYLTGPDGRPCPATPAHAEPAQGPYGAAAVG